MQKPSNAARVKEVLDNAKAIALTDEEQNEFIRINSEHDWPKLSRLVAKISERTGIPLPSGRIAHDEVGKRLLIVD